MDIREEALAQWTSGFANALRPIQYDSNFAKLIAERERESEQIVGKHLQPWLQILEDSIQWLANLTGILDRLNTDEKLENAERSIWALVGASCAHAIAVRRLVLSGLDTPARAEVRTLDEHLCACIAFLHDRKLAEHFQQCQSKKEANQFWYKHLNTKELKKHLNAVEQAVGLEQIISSDMRAWRGNEIEWFSQAVHPSYLGAALATHTLSAADPDVTGPSFLGMASACSERTLHFACKSIWYFSRFGFMMLFNEYKSMLPVISLEKDDEMHQVVVVGRQVLQELNQKYWSYEIFPSAEA